MTSRAWEVARTVVAPPSSVVNCLWEVFVWGFGVLFLSCACVSVSGGVVLCRCVCVCDLLGHRDRLFTEDDDADADTYDSDADAAAYSGDEL